MKKIWFGVLSLTLLLSMFVSGRMLQQISAEEIEAPPYSVTINAHCNTEGVDVSVSITMDGSPTGYSTPHEFTRLKETHTFTVPSTDANGHPFKEWSTGEVSTTVNVTSGGTYTAYYEAVDWWPMFHHDLRHTGHSTSTAPNTNSTLWSYTTGGDVFSSPAVADGVVYAGSWDNKTYALNATTGSLIWSYTTSGRVWSSPAIAGGVAYVGSDDWNVYALNASTGALIWSYTTGGVVSSSPAVADGKVYVGSWDDFFYALNATTGAYLWSFMTVHAVFSSPAVAGGRVYFGVLAPGDVANVYALNATMGAEIWDYKTFNSVLSSPAVAGDFVYVGSRDMGVHAFNATTGAKIWKYTTGSMVDSSPAVAGGVVYVVSDKVYALNATTGSSIWNYTAGGMSSPAVADGKVYVGSGSGFYALNATTGSLIWSYTTGGSSSPAVANGNVYVGLENKVFAFGPVPPGYRKLTITVTAGGTSSPEGTKIYPTGTIVSVTATPNIGYIFDHWELNGTNVGSTNPYSLTMDANYSLHAVFVYMGYDITINAHCSTERVYVTVSITMDGTPTGYNTPHTFTGLTGTHTFTVPSSDANGHLFTEWSTWSTSTTITVSSGGTYTAYYRTPPPPGSGGVDARDPAGVGVGANPR